MQNSIASILTLAPGFLSSPNHPRAIAAVAISVQTCLRERRADASAAAAAAAAAAGGGGGAGGSYVIDAGCGSLAG